MDKQQVRLVVEQVFEFEVDNDRTPEDWVKELQDNWWEFVAEPQDTSVSTIEITYSNKVTEWDYVREIRDKWSGRDFGVSDQEDGYRYYAATGIHNLPDM